ncbi:hypothetical protein AVEN_94885-1 [Araneus ventricosus]|uniref:SMB domain-containing protein n=1 Tax=Araneus ventricosus TaxID=182803 RepID=A0A4Y2EF31_ARAVE|nr:hypothetical protein AVEN_94885-1 [Araneus ventricosus]
MNFHSVVGVLPVFLFVGTFALEYSLLENLEMTCPTRDNCMLPEQNGTSFEDRSCECDNLCNVFRDCCIDKANPAPRRTRKYPCMTFGDQNKVGVYVVDTCPQNYRDSDNLRSLCQEGDDFTDPLVSAPVTVLTTGRTFKNRYCAECNGASPSSLESWLVYLNCEAVIPFQLNDTYMWQNLKYNLSLRTWGVELDDEFHRCELIFDKPDNLTNVRLCRANTIDSCPSSFLRTSVKRLCESYSAVVYDRENSYKNPHCAICNNKRVKYLTCLDPELFMRSAKLRFPFTFLLDMNRRNETEVDPVQVCPTGERYDPFFKKCRVLICALPGYKSVNGKCRKD